MPSTDHATPLALALNCWTVPGVSVAVRGLTVIAAAVPVPVSVAVAPVPPTASVACCGPVATGMNTTLTAQLAPGARLVPQLFVSENEAAPEPEIAMPPTASGPVPVLVSVSVCGALATMTVWLPNPAAGGDSVVDAPGRGVAMSDWISAAL